MPAIRRGWRGLGTERTESWTGRVAGRALLGTEERGGEDRSQAVEGTLRVVTAESVFGDSVGLGAGIRFPQDQAGDRDRPGRGWGTRGRSSVWHAQPTVCPPWLGFQDG